MPVAVMLDPNVLTDLEELTLCGYCKQKYNDTEQCPKFLSCKHYFCLRCIENNLLKGRELFCAHCWKRTELGDQGPDALPTHSPLLALANNFSHLKISQNNVGGAGAGAAAAAVAVGQPTQPQPQKPSDKERKSENCHTHGMPLALWCGTCCTALCRACATPQEHPGHQIKSQTDAKEQLKSDVQMELSAMSKLSAEIHRLQMQQRDFLMKVLEACITLKAHVETDLQNSGWSHPAEVTDARETFGKAKTSLQLSDCPAEVYSLHGEIMLEKQRLQTKYQEMMLQCQLDDLIGNSGVIFDFALLKQAVAGIHSGEPLLAQQIGNGGRLSNHLTASQNPILFLANYCMSQLYSRHVHEATTRTKQQHLQNGSIEYHMLPQVAGAVHVAPAAAPSQQPPGQQPQQAPPGQVPPGQQPPQAPPGPGQQLLIPPGSPSLKPSVAAPVGSSILQQSASSFINAAEAAAVANSAGIVGMHSAQQASASLRGPSNPCPMYYFNIEVNGSPHGRIVIEVRPDAAPKMAKNFSVLAMGEIGYGYKGCTIFQCWEGESVITGDFELNNGRGGRSIFDDGYFMPDDTKFPAIRGAVGMRRTQKRHDNLGMVGSQFRIILQEMRGFTGIFGHVVEGLDLVEKISTYGDQTGKPTKTILITKCGKL